MSCPICLNPQAVVQQPALIDWVTVNCPQCENFTISGSAQATLANWNSKEPWKISAWLVQNKPEVFTTADIETALESARPSLTTRAERMLHWLNAKFPPGNSFLLRVSSTVVKLNEAASTGLSVPVFQMSSASLARLIPVGWNRNIEETEFMIEQVLCNELGLVVNPSGNEYQVSPKGLLHLEGRKNDNATIGFCAMWFSDEVKSLWTDVIEPAIRAAGYEPLRIDSKQHNGKIDDEIMASIRGSRFVVADFTGSRGGVYYEAGFAHCLDLPVIFMCRDGDELHFDIRQYNCIFWKADALEDAQSRLKNRILATLGKGLLKV